ncbi:chromate resistance protein ChrB domain-containing protein [Variovorax sp. RT4R15]|uniref:chromate resistance protein ChrB domain-containing protein n=1 Tax=Variovorax sp. RT4R15 TaxID=3443737 RepID=UPI003F486352
MWSILLVTLPTQPSAVRLRIWRALKALGCAALRDGAYVLPLDQAHELEALGAEARAHGGIASVLALAPRDDAQQAEVLALFDRSEAYVQWREATYALQQVLDSLGETEARRRLRNLGEALAAVQRIDYYPGAALQQAQADLAALRGALDARFSKGEPRARPDDGIARLDLRKYQGKRWATRARPWVDRLACAWLIRRFVDPHARFVWLDESNAPLRTPRGALGFDYDGARFTHVGTRVTFEVLVASFELGQDAKLQRIAAAVHYLDVGGIPVPEATGLEAVLSGLRALHANDDRLLQAACEVFDALHAAPEAGQ